MTAGCGQATPGGLGSGRSRLPASPASVGRHAPRPAPEVPSAWVCWRRERRGLPSASHMMLTSGPPPNPEHLSQELGRRGRSLKPRPSTCRPEASMLVWHAQACRGMANADFRGRIASLGVGRLTSVNPLAGKLAARGDRRNVGAISLSGPRCRSTSSGLAALPHAFDRLVALGVHESSQRMVTAAANPTVSDCAVCRSVCRGLIRCQGRDAGKAERGSPAGGQGPIRCVRIGANADFHAGCSAQPFCGDHQASSRAVDALTWYGASRHGRSWRGIVVLSSC